MAKPISSELVLRINSALVLVALTLALTYAGTQTFAALILFAATLMSWEWGRVVRGTGIDGIFAIQSAAIIAAGLFHFEASVCGRCRHHFRRDMAGISPPSKAGLPE